MFRVVSLQLDFTTDEARLSWREPEIGRRPVAIDYARAIAAGEEADRQFFARYPKTDIAVRPVGPEELIALLERNGVRPLPGIPRPVLYAILDLDYSEARGIIKRALFPVTRKTWQLVVNEAFRGLLVQAGRLADSDPEHANFSRELYNDTISADLPSAGAA